MSISAVGLRYPADVREARAALDTAVAELTRRWPEILTFTLVVILAMQLAYWTWIFFTPKVPLPPQQFERGGTPDALAAVVDAHIFGTSTATAPAAVATATNMRLSGVFAAIGSLPAFAIISFDGQTSQPVRNGAAISPGIVLEAVFPDHVLILRNGARERLELDARSLGSAQPGVASAVQPQASVNIDAVGEREFRFSRAQLSGALQDPKTLSNMGRASAYPSGGVVLEEVVPGGLPERMGLRPGDVVRQVNGQMLSNPQDMPRIYQQFVKGGVNEVRLEVVRSGQPQQLIYHIQP